MAVLVKRLGVDLGTTTLRAHLRRQGLVLEEPSVVAYRRFERELVALGHAALDLEGRASTGVEIVRPIVAPKIADLTAAAALLTHLVRGTVHRLHPVRPDVVVSLPAGATTTQRRVLTEAAIKAGARQAWLIDGPIAAALGAGLPVGRATGCAVCDLGGGTTEVAVLAESGTVLAETIEIAGTDLDAAIQRYLERRRNLRIDPRTAEQLKRAVGTALPLEDPLAMEVRGDDVDTAEPRRERVGSGELTDALTPVLDSLAGAIRTVLASVPATFMAAIAADGLVLTGAGAHLRGLDEYLAQRLDVPVRVAPKPETCAVRGAVISMDGFLVFREKQLYLR
ncbi:MAG: rod shape-determining protein [Candidatus Dormiibacterota bacterium]